MCAHHADSTSVPARLTKNIWVFTLFWQENGDFPCKLRGTSHNNSSNMAISVDPRLLLCWSAEIKVEQILLWELPQNLLGGWEPIHNVGKSRSSHLFEVTYWSGLWLLFDILQQMANPFIKSSESTYPQTADLPMGKKQSFSVPAGNINKPLVIFTGICNLK